MHDRRPIPVQRRLMCVDHTELDIPGKKLRCQRQASRPCTDHENSRIIQHLEPAEYGSVSLYADKTAIPRYVRSPTSTGQRREVLPMPKCCMPNPSRILSFERFGFMETKYWSSNAAHKFLPFSLGHCPHTEL